jgi:hypothetical protein
VMEKQPVQEKHKNREEQANQEAHPYVIEFFNPIHNDSR